MDIRTIVRALRRRWYLVTIGLLLTGGLAAGVTYLVPLTYDAQASFVLLPPPPAQQQPGDSPLHDNPYLRLGGLDTMGGVLAKSLGDSTSILSIIAEGSPDRYVVAADPAVPGAVLQITGTARTPQRAFAIVDEVTALATTRLAELQATVNAPADSQVRLAVITDNTVAEPNTSTVIRTLIIVIGAGLIGTIFLTLAIDALIGSRRDKRASRLLQTIQDSPPAGQEIPPDAASARPAPTTMPAPASAPGSSALNRKAAPVDVAAEPDRQTPTAPQESSAAVADQATAGRWQP